jgi:hypothetical protein
VTLDELEMEKSLSSALARKIDRLADEVEFDHGQREEVVVQAQQKKSQ